MKTRLLIILVFGMIGFAAIPYSYAACAAPLLGPPGPCFDSFSSSGIPLTERSIMEDYARNIEMNYGEWQMSDRNWAHVDSELELPAIICTEFVVDGMKQHRMAKWVDAYKISSFEDHRNDWLCDKWLAPIDDGIKIKWDKLSYLSHGTGILNVIDNELNLDDTIRDVFEVHVWSDIDRNGIHLTVTETDNDTGIFTGKVYFTTDNKSSGARLLVEDGVHTQHKENYTFSRIVTESFTEDISSDELTDEQICGEGHVIVNGICMPKSIWDSSDFRGLQTGETMSNPEVAIILQSLGAILIVLFIVIYAVKKRMKKSIEEKK